MCGKFTALASWAEVVDFSQPLTIDPQEGGNDSIVGYRVGQKVPVVVYDPELPERLVLQMQWGFPHRSKRLDPIHCRSETIDTRPTFAPLFAEGQRGIVVVRTFNEANEKNEQHVIDPHDEAPLGFAVLWDKFENTTGDQIFACVQVTVPANQLITPVSDRMPAFLHMEDWPRWLGEEEATPNQLKAMLKTVEGVRWTMEREKKSSKAPPPKMPANSKDEKSQSDLF